MITSRPSKLTREAIIGRQVLSRYTAGNCGHCEKDPKFAPSNTNNCKGMTYGDYIYSLPAFIASGLTARLGRQIVSLAKLIRTVSVQWFNQAHQLRPSRCLDSLIQGDAIGNAGQVGVDPINSHKAINPLLTTECTQIKSLSCWAELGISVHQTLGGEMFSLIDLRTCLSRWQAGQFTIDACHACMHQEENER